MKSHRVILSVLTLLALSLVTVRGQDEFFHRGAQHFLVGSNELAKAEVARGLQMHPDDASLKKFWELLNQQQQQQQNQDDKQQDQKDQQKQDEQKQDQSKQDQSKEDKEKKSSQDKKDQEGKKQDQQQSQDKKQEQKEKDSQQSAKQDQEKKDGEKAGQGQPQKADDEQGNPNDPTQAMKAMRMTPQQAVRLLEAMKAEEQTLQFRPILRTNRTDRKLKDW
jgi:Ca-activated chloride channel family protein